MCRYQETCEMVREVVDENGGEYLCECSTSTCRVTINVNVNVSDTDVNEFLVRQMSSLFHVEDIELMQVRTW